MIKFKNINNLYGFNCLNIKVVKMKNETKKQISPINNANSNVNLKTHLTLALKNTSSIMKVLLPKIAVSVKDLIIEYKKLTEKNTDTDEKNNQIQMKALREHCYSLVGYNRKTDPNSAFEMVCTRAVKLGLMMTDHATEFDVDSKNSQIFVMSKIATPFKVEKLEGQVSATKKIPNNEENLVEVNTGVIDRVYNVKYGNPNKRKAKTKDEKVELTFKDNAKSFYKLFNKALDYSKKKDVRFFDLVDEETMKQLSLIDSLFNGENYKVMRSFSLDYQVSVEGELEKSSIGKNKKIA
tara:strand:+ start:467 stop:1351 length:885 start_codon:yes stop_codon:yes gene_type:complete